MHGAPGRSLIIVNPFTVFRITRPYHTCMLKNIKLEGLVMTQFSIYRLLLGLGLSLLMAFPLYVGYPSQNQAASRQYHGGLVIRIKQGLAQLGYIERGRFNSQYDDPTRRAIKKYQKDHGLKVDGIPTLDLYHNIRTAIDPRHAAQLARARRANQTAAAKRQKQAEQAKKAKNTTSSSPQTSHNLDYPWEAITINMSSDAIQKILQSYGLKKRRYCKARSGWCRYQGTIPGKWSGEVQWRIKNSTIELLSFKIRPKNPSQTKEHFYNRLIKIVPNGRSNPNCRVYRVAYGCRKIKVPTTPATIISFTVRDDGILVVFYGVRRIQ